MSTAICLPPHEHCYMPAIPRVHCTRTYSGVVACSELSHSAPPQQRPPSRQTNDLALYATRAIAPRRRRTRRCRSRRTRTTRAAASAEELVVNGADVIHVPVGEAPRQKHEQRDFRRLDEQP